MPHNKFLKHITSFVRRLRRKNKWRQVSQSGKRNHNSVLNPPTADDVPRVSFASETAQETITTLGFTSSSATLSTSAVQNTLSTIGVNATVLSPNVWIEPEDTDVKALIEVLKEVQADRGENGRYRQLLACKGDSAQGLLDLFQWLLDNDMARTPEFRNYLIVTMQRLSKKTNLHPVNYEKEGITNVVEMPSDGGCANIYQGCFLGRLVCLKFLRNKTAERFDLYKRFSKEAILWGQLSHPNVSPFYGLIRFRNGFALVSPWMENGDINAYLKNHPDANRVRLACDIACGLKYLHDNNIIHGDIKGANILVDDTERARITDFGMSSISDPNIPATVSHSAPSSKGGTTRWQAPEILSPRSDVDVPNTTASDVYAYAYVLFEIFVGRVPFFQYSSNIKVAFRVVNGERPPQPERGSQSWEEWGLTENIWLLMEQCWSANVEERPTVATIITQLTANPGYDGGGQVNEKTGSLLPADFGRLVPNAVDTSVEAFEALLQDGSSRILAGL